MKESTTNNPLHRIVKIQWTEVAPAPVGHSAHTAVFLDGKVYIGGGDSNIKIPIYHIDVYNVSENNWTPPIITKYCYFSLASLNENLVVVGGKDRTDKVSKKMFILCNNQLKKCNNMSQAR